MTIGIRIRDPVTGVVRLDVQDFTVRVVYESFMAINGNGGVVVPGITPDNAGAFLIPGFQAGWPVTTDDHDYYGRVLPKMPIVTIGQGTVSWRIGAGQTLGQMWQILVVRYK